MTGNAGFMRRSIISPVAPSFKQPPRSNRNGSGVQQVWPVLAESLELCRRKDDCCPMIHAASKRKSGGVKKRQNPWDSVQGAVLIRHDTETGEDTPLEAGVNFFVLMLEQLGATTRFSCEGHPDGFYVVFQ